MLKIRAKNNEAFNEIYGRYSTKILSFLYRMTYGNEDTAQDLLQDTFIKVIDKAHSFDAEKKFSTWIYTIASNLCKNELRRIAIRRNNQDDIAVLSENSISEHEKTENNMDQKYLVSIINSEMDSLKMESRKLLILRFREEMAVKDIARIMDIPEGTVKSRLHHVIKKLASKLNKKIQYN